MKPLYVTINMKHSDMAELHLKGENQEVLAEYEDGMPNLGILGGDYTKLTIENATGKIIGWKPIELEDGDTMDGESAGS